jgi:hypothetical protein
MDRHLSSSNDHHLRGESMDKPQLEVMFSFRGITKYGDVHPLITAGASPETAAIGAQMIALKGVIARAEDAAATQHTTKADTLLVARDEEALKTELEARIRSIAMVARGLRGTVPGIGIVVMPKSGRGIAKLLDGATGFARKVAVYQSVLAEHGLPQDVLGQLERAIDAVRQSRDERLLARSSRAGGTRSVKEELEIGRGIVKVLDGAMTHLLRNQPGELAAWKSVKRLPRHGGGVQSAVSLVQSPVSVAQSPVSAAATTA